MGVRETRLYPAHYSVDARAFLAAAGSPETRPHLREQCGTPRDAFVVVCSAKAIARKRLDDAIRAVARLGPTAHLWIVGDGPLRPQLEVLVQKACRPARPLAWLPQPVAYSSAPGRC